jgi:hypothetical protein
MPVVTTLTPPVPATAQPVPGSWGSERSGRAAMGRPPQVMGQLAALRNWAIFRSSSPVRRAWMRMCCTATSHCASL